MKNIIILIFLLCLSVIGLGEKSVAGLPDAPHNENSEVLAITCASCHSVMLPEVDRSAICVDCHDGDPAIAMGNHSAAVIHQGEDPGTWPYGNWSVVCLDCHDPHLHFQLTHLSQLQDDLYLITGAIDSISPDSPSGFTTVTYSAPTVRPGWDLPASNWGAKTSAGRGLIFVADGNNPQETFEIVSSDAMTIVVNGVMDSGLAASLTDPQNPTVFGIIYGQLIKSEVATPTSGNRVVKFFDPSGGFVDVNNDPAPGGFVDESATSTPEGICQVCHTATQYWKNDATGLFHPDDGNIKCNDCHDHAKGFAGACESCHGYPPGVLVFDPGITNSSTAGAHDYHVTALGFSCSTCHKDSVGTGATHNNNLTVTMGFYAFNGAAQGGDYIGQAAVTYDTTVTSPATTAVTPGTDQKTCSNLYCHGNYDGSGKNATATWDNPTTAVCGTCHGASNNEPPGLSADLTDGAHTQHAYNLQPGYETWPREFSCTLCHNGIVGGIGPAGYTISNQALHVSGFVDWQFDTSDPRLDITSAYSIPAGSMEPSDGVSRAYGQCNNVYCHSNVQPIGGIGPPSAYDSPVWGDSKSVFEICIGCHNQEGENHSIGISTGSHVKHVQEYWFGMSSLGGNAPWDERKCTICHKWNDSFDGSNGRDNCNQCHFDGEKQYHVNGSVDILFDSFAPGTATYTGSAAPGDGYGACANLYCHSDGTSVSTTIIPANTSAQWGGGLQPCDACHTYPPNYTNGTPKANSHIVHSGFSCNFCHSLTTSSGTAISDTNVHVNKAYDVQAGGSVSFDYTFAVGGGTCTNNSCHSDPSVQWGQTIPVSINCVGCHIITQDNGDGIPTGGRRGMATEFPANNSHAHYGAQLDDAACLVCHDQTTHKDGYVDLIDPDGGSNFRFENPEDLSSDPDLSNFCMNCHDTNGATRLAAPLDPFGNGNVPPPAATKFMGSLQWDELQYYENCQPPGSSLRSVNSHHDISDADQAFSGAKLECLNCHGVHNSSQTQPVADPNNTSSPWTGTDNAFCLECHSGGEGPGAPGFPTGVEGPLFSVPAPDPNAGSSCGPGLVYDCQGNCVDDGVALSYIGDGYCDNGQYGFYLWCAAFSNDGDDCGPPCQDNNCSSLTGINTCNYSGPPWWTDYKWKYSAHGTDSKRGWGGYAQSPQAPSYELDCTECHDPHGSYSLTNTVGNPYMIRDTVDGTGFVDDGSIGFPGGTQYGWDGVAGDWSQYGTAGDVIIGITDPLTGAGPELEALCSKCHIDWLEASASHEACGQDRAACIFCHQHGGTQGGLDWGGVAPRDDTPCPTP